MLKVLTLIVLAILLATGCGGDDEKAAGGGGSAAKPAATPDPETAVREAFDGYNEALAARDWEGACERMAPETIEKLQENVKTLGVDAPGDCAGTMRVLIEQTERDPETKGVLLEIARTAKIERVVVRGEVATVKWSATSEGKRVAVTHQIRRIGDEWKLVDVSN